VDLSIIIVNWNTRDLLAHCLTSVYKHAPACAYEVIVVDNASTDDSASMIKERFAQARLIENATNVGFACANNQAIVESEGKYLLLLNSDAMVQPGSLDAMLYFAESHPELAALGPKLVNPDATFQASYAAFPTLWSELMLLTGLSRWYIGPYAPSPRPRVGECARSVGWVAGAAMLLRRSAIEDVGLLDEGYFLYGEETDWCFRFHRHGWEIWYLPDVAITHVAGASSRKRPVRSYVSLYSGKLRFFNKSYGRATAGWLAIIFILLAALRVATWSLLLLGLPKVKRQSTRQRLSQDLALLRWALDAKAQL
jgi:GT2 family glycosyltransferase